MIRIITTLVCLVAYNFAAFWVSKVVVTFSLSLKYYTEFGINYVTYATFAAGFLFATIYAFFTGSAFAKRRGKY
ncbi:hypothetical protein [Sporosarcina sp. FSL K6-5500]|uniref:hypothetical protein n=1 Tax=Sporosarcina sp. FSL K6-5500 TaxID=2921558 RepID=UPI0030F4F8F2